MDNLLRYIDVQAVDHVKYYIDKFDVDVIICHPSKTRLAVFIVKKDTRNMIKINNNLNKYTFLITLVHELAHACVWQKYKRIVAPHGEEWKESFKEMMIPFLNPLFFPEDILRKLSYHLINPSSSIVRDISLFYCLLQYDKHKKNMINQLNDGDRFKDLNGREFQRVCKMRKNYKCIDIANINAYNFLY